MTQPSRYCIVGGVAGGASAATRLRRLDEQAEIILFERGPYISFANCGLPYHIGGQIAERDDLLITSPKEMRSRARIDVRTGTEVIAIDRAARTLTARHLATGAEERIAYDTLILSPGASPLLPPIPGREHPRIRSLRTIPDMDGIIALIAEQRAQSALVVGGGYIGLEMVEALRERGLATTLVELAPQVMGPADPEMASLLHQELALHGVDLVLGRSVTAFADAGGRVAATLSDGSRVEADLVILAIGVKPETALAAAAGLALGARGGIAVDPHLRTSDEHIYAVGDAIEVRDLVGGELSLIPLAGPANRQGRIAAENIAGRPRTWGGTQGSAICKVFGQTIAMTGMNEKTARRLGRPYEKVYVHPLDHAEYYPGAQSMTLKLLFEPGSGRVLGAQAVGAAGVDKRIDVLAMAIRAGLGVRDLGEAELCYAPPYGAAKDPVNVAAHAAINLLDGLVQPLHAEQVAAWRGPILAVGTAAEQEVCDLPGAINIPIDELRQRIAEVPRTGEVLVYCPAGRRGYAACRILAAHGIPCRNLVGGYKVYKMHASDPASFHRPPAGAAPAATTAAPPAVQPAADLGDALTIDACGLQCPGPILQLKKGIDRLAVGQVLSISATDPGFVADIPAWCSSTGHELLGLAPAPAPAQGGYRARIRKCAPGAGPAAATAAAAANMTIVAFSGDWDRIVAAFIIANGAASMGLKPTLFFTFWGLNALRRDHPPAVDKTVIERMFGWMMPRGARRLALSKMHMAGMGKAMMVGIMKAKNVDDLPTLIATAQANGVRLVACAMSMDLMGIKPAELIDGVETGGVASYLGVASTGRVNLFI